MKKILPTLIVAFIIFQNHSLFAQLSGCYDPSNWTIDASNTGPNTLEPGVVFDNMAGTITLTADGDFMGVSGTMFPAGIPFDCSFEDGLVMTCIEIPADGEVSFNWSYTMQQFFEDPANEPFGYCLNSADFVALSYSGLFEDQTGTANIGVSAGDQLCLVQASYFSEEFQAVTTVSEFMAPSCPVVVTEGLTDCYEPANWTTNTDNTSGSVQANETTITINNDTDQEGSGLDEIDCANQTGNVSFCITMPTSGEVSFDWSVEGGPLFNPLVERFGYCINGLATELTSIDPPPFGTTSGSAVFNVMEGDELCLVYASKFADGGSPSPATLTNFIFPECPGSSQVSLEMTVINGIFCNGDSTGAIEVNVFGGTPPYTFLGNPTFPLAFLPAGLYCLTVVDAEGIEASSCTELVEPPAIMANATLDGAVSCFGGADGAASVDVSGGIPNYTIQWDNGETGPMAIALPSGEHTVSIVDSFGCEQEASLTVPEPPAIFIDLTSTPYYPAPSIMFGTATASVGGGTPPYSYEWNTDPVQTTETAIDLESGEYSVTVTDANGCETSGTVSVDFVDAVEDIASVKHFNLYPNPSSGNIFIELNLEKTDHISLKLFNQLGREIENIAPVKTDSFYKNFNWSTLPSGLYFLNIKVGEEEFSQVVILE